MITQAATLGVALEARARQSLGSSERAIYDLVSRLLEVRDVRGDLLIDVGCGQGALWPYLRRRFHSYCGLDAIRYQNFPDAAEFSTVDLDSPDWPVAVARADLVTAVEVVEHLENPWAFMRQLAVLVKPGGWVVVTTPNQLSLLSLGTLLIKRRFSSFQDAHYPAHRTALLESDLVRAAFEASLEVEEIAYTCRGRVVLTPWHYPGKLAQHWPRALSDNLAVIARRPPSTT